MIGKKLSPILTEIETTILEHEIHHGAKPEYSDDAFRAATKIFMSATMDKMFDLQMREKMNFDDSGKMAEKFGCELRKLIKVYTNIDTYEFYK